MISIIPHQNVVVKTNKNSNNNNNYYYYFLNVWTILQWGDLTRYRCMYNSIQLLPALKVNIIIVHPRGVVFLRAKVLYSRGNTTPLGWTIMMFTLSAGINCFIILKLYFICIILISFDKCEHFCKWTARMVPLGTPR